MHLFSLCMFLKFSSVDAVLHYYDISVLHDYDISWVYSHTSGSYVTLLDNCLRICKVISVLIGYHSNIGIVSSRKFEKKGTMASFIPFSGAWPADLCLSASIG